MSDTDTCDRVTCRHEKKHHRDKKAECTVDVTATEKCKCHEFVIKDLCWYLKKVKWFLLFGAIGCVIFTLSLFTDYSEIKESTVLTTGNDGSVGFYLDKQKVHKLSVTSVGATITHIYIITPLGVQEDPIPDDGNNFEKKYSYTPKISGIHNFVATVDKDDQWLTFVVREESGMPIIISQSAAQVLSFIGGSIIGFSISMIHTKYNIAKDERIH